MDILDNIPNTYEISKQLLDKVKIKKWTCSSNSDEFMYITIYTESDCHINYTIPNDLKYRDFMRLIKYEEDNKHYEFL